LFVEIIGNPFHENNIISVEKKDMNIATSVCITQLASSKQPSNLSMYMPNRVGNKGQQFLTPLLQLISSNQHLVVLNLEINFSHNLITIAFNSKGIFLLHPLQWLALFSSSPPSLSWYLSKNIRWNLPGSDYSFFQSEQFQNKFPFSLQNNNKKVDVNNLMVWPYFPLVF